MLVLNVIQTACSKESVIHYRAMRYVCVGLHSTLLSLSVQRLLAHSVQYKATPNRIQLLFPFQTYAAGLCNWNVKHNFLRETVIVSCNFRSTQGYDLQGYDAM